MLFDVLGGNQFPAKYTSTWFIVEEAHNLPAK